MSCSSVNFNEIKIYDDELDNFGIIKDIIDSRDEEDAFYILDLEDVMAKHQAWRSMMPRVEPFYAVKCNPHPTVIKILAALGTSFDCASKNEIAQVMEFGVPGEKIIFANTVKTHSHIKFAREVGVDKLTVDNEAELLKIRDLFPDAKVIIRFRCDAEISLVNLGSKFGCHPEADAPRLIQATLDLGLNLHGFSFHVGSGCGEITAFSRAIDVCGKLLRVAKEMGCKSVKMIDIGGGFPGDAGSTIKEFAEVINTSLEAIDPSIKVISEPGRYFVSSAAVAATFLHSKRTIIDGNKKQHMYYINDGFYGSFAQKVFYSELKTPISLTGRKSDEKCIATIWGPTCNSSDYVIKDTLLPEFEVGDWLIWMDMGAYTQTLSSTFNGFLPPLVYPFMRKSAWKSACMRLGLKQQNGIHQQKFSSDIHMDSRKVITSSGEIIAKNGNLYINN